MLYNVSANGYFGKFYSSAQGGIRIDVPAKFPFFFGFNTTYNHWNYYSTSNINLESEKPDYVDQTDFRIMGRVGFPWGKNGITEIQTGYIFNEDLYSPNNTLKSDAVFDKTNFDGLSFKCSFEHNTLNRKQLATSGSYITFSGAYYSGDQQYTPGTYFEKTDTKFYQSLSKFNNIKIGASWYNAKFRTENYFSTKDLGSIGYVMELNYSNKPLFTTYYGTLLSAPTFNPTLLSKTLFLVNYRANTYGAVGLVYNVVPFPKFSQKIESRIEAYWFQPWEKFDKGSITVEDDKNNIGITKTNTKFPNLPAGSFALSQTLSWITGFGPLSFTINYQDDIKNQFSIALGFGYLLYNKRSLE